MEKSRVEWIDSCKGFAIILVVIGHIADGYINANSFPEYSSVLRGIFNGIYMFHMALFFTLSGMTYQLAYVPKEKVGTEYKRLKSQVINLLLLYIVYCFLNWIFKIVVSEYVNVNKPVSVIDILLIWGKPIYQYWFFYVLIALYLIFTLRALAVCANSGVVLMVLTAISMLSGFVDTRGWFQIMHILFFAVFFFIGMQFIKDSKKFRMFSFPWVLIIFTVSLALAVIWRNKETVIYSTPIVNTIVAYGFVLASIALFAHFRYFDEKSIILNYLGKHSLEIYVTHCFLTSSNRVFLPKVGITDFYMGIFLNFIISLSLPLVFSEITKKLGIWNAFFAPQRIICRENRE